MARLPLPDAALLHALITPDGLISVRVTPNAKADAITIEDGKIKVRVTVVPEDGKANKAVVALLAKTLGHPKSALSIARGETSRDKLIRVEGSRVKGLGRLPG